MIPPASARLFTRAALPPPETLPVAMLVGRILREDRVLCQEVEVFLQAPKPMDPPTHWSGQFTCPPGIEIDTRKPYRLELQDGRAGDFLAKNPARSTTRETVVLFRGCAPLV